LTGHVAATQICQAVSSNEEAIWFGAAQGLSCELVAAFANPAELQYEKLQTPAQSMPLSRLPLSVVPAAPISVHQRGSRR